MCFFLYLYTYSYIVVKRIFRIKWYCFPFSIQFGYHFFLLSMLNLIPITIKIFLKFSSLFYIHYKQFQKLWPRNKQKLTFEASLPSEVACLSPFLDVVGLVTGVSVTVNVTCMADTWSSFTIEIALWSNVITHLAWSSCSKSSNT